jgi:hypothetical protein
MQPSASNGAGQTPVDGRLVGKALNDVVRPLLKAAGFARFAGRTAWRDSEYTVDYVNFPSFTRCIADGVGCTTYSFTGEVGVFYRCFGPDNDRPKGYEFTFRATLGKTLRQPIFRSYGRSASTDRPDVWFVTEDGRTLAACIAGARHCLEAQGLPFLDKFRQPQRAFESLLTERSTDTGIGEQASACPETPTALPGATQPWPSGTCSSTIPSPRCDLHPSCGTDRDNLISPVAWPPRRDQEASPPSLRYLSVSHEARLAGRRDHHRDGRCWSDRPDERSRTWPAAHDVAGWIIGSRWRRTGSGRLRAARRRRRWSG